MRAAVFAGEVGPTAGQVDEHRDRDIVEMGEPGLRGQDSPPSRVHRVPGIVEPRIIGGPQAHSQSVCGTGEVERSDATGDHSGGEHVETGGDPRTHQVIGPGVQADHSGFVEALSALGEHRKILPMAGVRYPDSTFSHTRAQTADIAHRSQRCRYSR